EGAGDGGGGGEGDARPHDTRDRPPAGNDRAGRQGRGAREGPDRRARNARRAFVPLAPVPGIARARERGRLVNERPTLGEIWRETRDLIRPVRARYLAAAAAVTVSTLLQ